jgi:hypothetical protein
MAKFARQTGTKAKRPGNHPRMVWLIIYQKNKFELFIVKNRSAWSGFFYNFLYPLSHQLPFLLTLLQTLKP